MEKEKKREEFVTKIGPLLRKVFDKQKEIVKKTTWDCVASSDYEVGEIIAKKITSKDLLKVTRS
jgi:hypothetical protein